MLFQSLPVHKGLTGIFHIEVTSWQC